MLEKKLYAIKKTIIECIYYLENKNINKTSKSVNNFSRIAEEKYLHDVEFHQKINFIFDRIINTIEERQNANN